MPFSALPPPAIFAPRTISGPANDGSPTFTPDGKTLFFTRSGSGAGTIMVSHFSQNAWSSPRIAPFSGTWNDQHPTMAPDGSYVIFVSTRPVAGIASRVAHLWRVDRRGDGWTEPVHLPEQVNLGPRIFAPSIASDGTLYFLSIGDRRAFQLYRARSRANGYESARPLTFSTPATADVDPEIAPDQSFIVFASSGRTKGDTNEHLFVAYRRGDGWSEPVALHYDGDATNGGSNDNEPNLGPGGRMLYFSSDRTLSLQLPRTRAAAEADLARIAAWDNGDLNVWMIPLPVEEKNGG